MLTTMDRLRAVDAVRLKIAPIPRLWYGQSYGVCYGLRAIVDMAELAKIETLKELIERIETEIAIARIKG